MVVGEVFDGHVHQFLLKSLSTGQTVSKFNFEITEKSTSTYQDVNWFKDDAAGQVYDSTAYNFLFDDFDEEVNDKKPDDTEVYDCLFEPYDAEEVDDTVESIVQQNVTVVPSTGSSSRFKACDPTVIDTLKKQNTEPTTDKQTKWAVTLLKGKPPK